MFEQDKFATGIFGFDENSVDTIRNIIEAKYGPPTQHDTTTIYDGWILIWANLQAPGTSDKIRIQLKLDRVMHRAWVFYEDLGLQQRLRAQEKNGL